MRGRRSWLPVTVARWLLMVKFIKRPLQLTEGDKKCTQKRREKERKNVTRYIHSQTDVFIHASCIQSYSVTSSEERIRITYCALAQNTSFGGEHSCVHGRDLFWLSRLLFSLRLSLSLFLSFYFSLLALCLCTHNCYKHSFVRCMDLRTLQQTLVLFALLSSPLLLCLSPLPFHVTSGSRRAFSFFKSTVTCVCVNVYVLSLVSLSFSLFRFFVLLSPLFRRTLVSINPLTLLYLSSPLTDSLSVHSHSHSHLVHPRPSCPLVSSASFGLDLMAVERKVAAHIPVTNATSLALPVPLL